MWIELFHLAFLFFIVSIPFWPKKYLKYGVYIPLILTSIWVLFDGCPLTRFHYGLNDEVFAQVLMKPIFPDIDKVQTTRITYWILILITVVSFLKLQDKF